VRIEASDGDVTAFLQGRLDAAAVEGASTEILEPIGRARVRDVIIDGSQATYCDGAGIGLIGELRRVPRSMAASFGSGDSRGIFRR